MKLLNIHSFIFRWLAIVAAVMVAGCGGASSNLSETSIVFTTTLVGSEEVPPTQSQGRGIGILVFDTATRNFTATIASTGVQDTDAHIHEGPPGTAGPIIFPMTKEQGRVVWSTSGTLDPTQEATLRAGNYYFNVHSPTFPAGEIRGQITEQFPTDEQMQQLQQLIQTSEPLRQQLQQLWDMFQAQQQSQ